MDHGNSRDLQCPICETRLGLAGSACGTVLHPIRRRRAVDLDDGLLEAAKTGNFQR